MGSDLQFKLLPLVVIGGFGQESQRQGGNPKGDMGIQAGDEGNSRDRCFACLHQDGQGAVHGSPPDGGWRDSAWVESQVGRCRLSELGRVSGINYYSHHLGIQRWQVSWSHKM